MIGAPPKVFHPRCSVTIGAVLQNGVKVAFEAIPRSVEVARNSARKADTCQVVLDWRDFPLDPRMMSSVYVEVYLDNLINPALPFIRNPLVNRRFVGLADSPEVVIGDDSTVKLDCRDYTGLFLDARWSLPIAVTQSLQSIVEFIRVTVAPETLPAVFMDPKAAASVPGLSVMRGRTVYNAPDNASAWDVLVDLCALYGLVPCWNLDVLEIRTADAAGLGNAMFILGQNIERLTLTRDFKGPKRKPVVVKCWDPVNGIPLTGLWSGVSSDPPIKMGPNGTAKPSVEAVQYNVVGSYTVDELNLLAKRIYDEAAQRQIEGELETRDLTDTFGAGVLGLANGDTLIMTVDPGIAVGIDHMTEPEAVAYLANPYRQNSLTPDVAALVVAAYRQALTLDTQFYVKEALHSWDRDSGYRLMVRFINFVFGAGL